MLASYQGGGDHRAKRLISWVGTYSENAGLPKVYLVGSIASVAPGKQPPPGARLGS